MEQPSEPQKTDASNDQISFGQYLQSPENKTNEPDEVTKKIEEEKNRDEDRLKRINQIVGEYENQAKESEENLQNKTPAIGGLAKINAEVEALKSDPNYSLGDIEQFVTELHEDIPEDLKEQLKQKKKADAALKAIQENNDAKGPAKNKIQIDLYGYFKAELDKKNDISKKRKQSPNMPVHERLYATAQEKEARMQLENEERKKLLNFKPEVNKESKEILKTKGHRPVTAIDVFFIISKSIFKRKHFIKMRLKDNKKLKKLKLE